MTGDHRQRWALLNLGGTIGEFYDGERLSRRSGARMLLAAAGLPQAWPAYDIALIDSADMTFDVLELAASVVAGDRTSAGFILCCGTDMLEEIAYAASLLMPADRPIVVTAAALPSSEPGADGPANLRRAAALLATGMVAGTLVVMGDTIFPASGIVKIEPQGGQPFAALDGPLGRFRGGAPTALLPIPRDDRFRGLSARDCAARVAILHESMGGTDFFVDPLALDGLVVASAGAGGLSDRTYSMLRAHYLPIMPVILSTRCPFGFAVNPELPKYDQARARADGFRLEGYTQLSAVQARIRLILEIGLTSRKLHQP